MAPANTVCLTPKVLRKMVGLCSTTFSGLYALGAGVQKNGLT